MSTSGRAETSAPTPGVVLERLRSAFGPVADPQRAAGAAAYMRGQFVFLGVPTPLRRQLAGAALHGLARPTETELGQIALLLWEQPEREYQYAGCDYLRRHVGVASADFVPVLSRLVSTKAWWDTVDALAAHVVGELVRRHPRLVRTMDQWVRSDDVWTVRAALLHQLASKDATDEPRLLRYCSLRAADQDFFIRKAIGWALRQHAARRPEAVDAYLAATPQLSPLSVREARRGIARARPLASS